MLLGVGSISAPDDETFEMLLPRNHQCMFWMSVQALAENGDRVLELLENSLKIIEESLEN